MPKYTAQISADGSGNITNLNVPAAHATFAHNFECEMPPVAGFLKMSKMRILITIPTVNHISYFLALRLRAARFAAATPDLPKRRLGCCFKEPTRTGLGVILISGNGGTPKPFFNFAQ